MALDTMGMPDLYAAEEALKQREQLAQILAQRGATGVAPLQAGTPVSPTQGIAQIMNAHFGRQARQQNEAQRRQLAEAVNRRMGEGVEDYLRMRQGTGVQPDPQEFQQSADQGTPPPAPARGDPQAAIRHALLSRNPLLQKLGIADMSFQNELDKPRVLNPGDRLAFPGGQRPDVQGPPLTSKTAIPPTWEQALPPGAKRQQNDPPGIFRMPGAEGVDEVFAMKFDQGQLAGYQKLDNATVKLATGGAGGGNPFYSPVSTAKGVWSFDHRSGKMVQVMDDQGKPIVRETADPTLKGDIKASEAAGTVRGRETEEARLILPQATADAERALRLVDEMVGTEDGTVKPHKGFKSAVGWTYRPGARFVHGSPEADFQARLEEIHGGAFLTAFEKLKGGGHITEIEGVKATQAINRMKLAQGEEEFLRAARDFQGVVRAAVKNLKTKAAVQPTGGGVTAPSVDDLVKKYGGS